MALIDRQVRDRIVSRGLGNTGTDLQKQDLENAVKKYYPIKSFVYLDKLYYPTTGVVSKEEDIKGWHWDRTTAQEYRPGNSQSKEITDHIGGYKYNLLEGTKREDYTGSVIDGCELKEIKEVPESKGFSWNPVIKTGSYSLKGIDKPLYSSSSINKIFDTASLDLSNYAATGNLDNVTVAMYKRDEFLIKTIYREYKETNKIYKYTVNEATHTYVIDGERVLDRNSNINEDNITNAIFKSLELVGSYNSRESNRQYYLKFFPAIDVSVYIDRIKIDDITIDKDLGIIKIDKIDKSGDVRVAYKAVPRIDFEMQPEVGFQSKLDIKPHNYNQSNGLIEITCEERHVAKIALYAPNLNSVLGQSLKYGSDSAQLTASVLNSLNQPVDEIPVTFKSLDTNQEVYFEGNLLENVSESNSNGEAYTSINAPLSSEASSYFFPGAYPSAGFTIDTNELTEMGDVAAKAIIFEVLACDPFYGSKGITLNVSSILEDSGEWYFPIETNLDSQDYKLFRNALDKNFVNAVDGVDCFEVFYNSGFAKFNGNTILDSLLPNYKMPIKRITKDKIYVHGVPPATTTISNFSSITLFQKNSNYNLSTEPKGVERVLYFKENTDSSLTLMTPDSAVSGILTYYKLQNRQNDDLVVGYRIYVPRKTRLQASCIDPATGNTILSNIISVNVELPDIYKSEISFYQTDDSASTLDIMNYISYDAVDNNFYFEGSN